MKKFLAILLFTFLLLHVQAQVKELQAESAKEIKKDAADTSAKLWKKGGVYNIVVSQGSLSNWAGGGDKFSLSLNSLLSLYAFYKKEKYSWDNTFDFNLSYVKTTSLGSRKNDDRFDLLSKYGYALNDKLSIAALLNFRSQFFKGFTYDENNNNTKSLSSNFLSPAYLLLSLGLDYKPTKSLSIFISPVTSRWTIVKDDTLSAKGAYGVDPGSHSNYEIGAFASINYLKEFNKFITYKGKLDLFSNYKHDPQNVDLYMTNMLSAKLGKNFTMTWSVDMIYDDDVRLFGKNNRSAALQLKSIIGLGLRLRF